MEDTVKRKGDRKLRELETWLIKRRAPVSSSLHWGDYKHYGERQSTGKRTMKCGRWPETATASRMTRHRPKGRRSKASGFALVTGFYWIQLSPSQLLNSHGRLPVFNSSMLPSFCVFISCPVFFGSTRSQQFTALSQHYIEEFAFPIFLRSNWNLWKRKQIISACQNFFVISGSILLIQLS